MFHYAILWKEPQRLIISYAIVGASVWKKFSTEEGLNPDVTLVGIGTETTAEVIVSFPQFCVGSGLC